MMSKTTAKMILGGTLAFVMLAIIIIVSNLPPNVVTLTLMGFQTIAMAAWCMWIGIAIHILLDQPKNPNVPNECHRCGKRMDAPKGIGSICNACSKSVER